MVAPLAKIPSFTVVETMLPGVVLLDPVVFRDGRGFFFESYSQRAMADAGIPDRFVQDNHSFSTQNVVRGLHYQIGSPQAKLVRVIGGEIFDVAVDLRRGSPTFGKWYGAILSGDNNLMMWIPTGLAHGFSVLSAGAHVLYKATGFYAPELERTIAWNDPELAIDWRLKSEPVISAKDSHGAPFRDAETFE